jgi:phage gp46-like protein
VAGLGSNLWLLGRDKATQNAMNLAEQYIREALQWMLDDGVVQDIQVDVSAQGPVETRVMAVSIRLSFASGATQVIEFADLWTAQFSDTYYLNTGAK